MLLHLAAFQRIVPLPTAPLVMAIWQSVLHAQHRQRNISLSFASPHPRVPANPVPCLKLGDARLIWRPEAHPLRYQWSGLSARQVHRSILIPLRNRGPPKCPQVVHSRNEQVAFRTPVSSSIRTTAHNLSGLSQWPPFEQCYSRFLKHPTVA
jgi:hypothetical protein